MNNWKTRLKESRKEKKLTMEQLARKVGGITKSAISLWENPIDILPALKDGDSYCG